MSLIEKKQNKTTTTTKKKTVTNYEKNLQKLSIITSVT